METLRLKDPVAAEELREIVKRIVDRFHPGKIILYGSFAYGTPREDSDFDVLAVLHDPISRKEEWDATQEIEIKRTLQLRLMGELEFEETKDVVGGFAYAPHHWGRILHTALPDSNGRNVPPPIMRTREQVIWDFIQGWLGSAKQKLRLMEMFLKEEPESRYLGFYSQIAAENFIRAILVWRQVPWRKTHEIRKLLDLFPAGDAALARELSSADWLTPYGVSPPDPSTAKITPVVGRKAYEEAKRVRDRVTAYFKDYLSKGRPGGPLSRPHGKDDVR